VHDHRAAEAARETQRVLDRADVVPVDRAEVLEAEVFEHALRLQHVLQAALHAVQRPVDRLAHHRGAAQCVLHLAEHPLVAGTQSQSGQVVGEPAGGRRVRAAVVVDDDDHRAVGPGDVVQRLPAHAAGQRAVADHGDHRPPLAAHLVGLGETVGVGQRGRRVRVLDPVVRALGPARVAGQPAALPQRRHLPGTPGEQLVHICLVPDVEQDRLGWRVEHPVQRDGEFDDAQIGAEVAPGPGDRLHQDVADLCSEGGEVVGVQGAEVGRRSDAV
jgi:hypothetical protein